MYLLFKQVYYYQDVKCRDEMYDKDILMLQVGDTGNISQCKFLVFTQFDIWPTPHIIYR